MPDLRPGRVRNAAPADTTALANLFEAVALFEQSELVELAELLHSYFNGDLGSDHHWLVYDENALVGAAYYALDTSPERLAPGTWNLYFIGVQPDRQGSGCGSALLHYVENALVEDRALELLVETSGKESFAATRSFYRKHGYSAVACITDAYNVGDDKIIFRKNLVRASSIEGSIAG